MVILLVIVETRLLSMAPLPQAQARSQIRQNTASRAGHFFATKYICGSTGWTTNHLAFTVAVGFRRESAIAYGAW